MTAKAQNRSAAALDALLWNAEVWRDPEAAAVVADLLEEHDRTAEAEAIRQWPGPTVAQVLIHHATHMVGPFPARMPVTRGRGMRPRCLVVAGHPHQVVACEGLETEAFGLGPTLWFLATRHPYMGPTVRVVFPSRDCFFLDEMPPLFQPLLLPAVTLDATTSYVEPPPESAAGIRHRLTRWCLWVADAQVKEVSPLLLDVVVTLRPEAKGRHVDAARQTIANILAFGGRPIRWSLAGASGPEDTTAPAWTGNLEE